MQNILLVVDTKNIFNSLHKTYGNGKLDYQKFVTMVAGGEHIYTSLAYGQQSENNSIGFITVLNKLGFVSKFKQLIKVGGQTIYTNNNVQLAVDVVDQVSSGKIDKVVIGSSDAELVDLVDWVRRVKGLPCDIVACRVPKVLRDASSLVVELDEDMLLK